MKDIPAKKLELNQEVLRSLTKVQAVGLANGEKICFEPSRSAVCAPTCSTILTMK